MEYKILGKTGEKLTEIGVGTWQLDKRNDESLKALRFAIDNGVNFIDTAEIYGTEDVVAKAVEGKNGLFIATKLWPTHFRYNDALKACDASIRRLGVKRIDLYQLHWPNKTVPISETMKAMEKLVDDGKIRYIGVSNFSERELEEALASMKKYEIVSNQVEYNILMRAPERGLSGYMKKEGMTLIAYSPLTHGSVFRNGYERLLGELATIGKNYGKTTAQVMINWLIRKEGVIPIPKASSVEHMKEDLGATTFKLSVEDVKRIDELTKRRGLYYHVHKNFRHFVTFYLKMRRFAKPRN